MSGTDLRTYLLIDKMQPQFASFLGTIAKGDIPLPGQAAAYVEIAPGMAINRLTDIVLKASKVRPGMQIVDRQSGVLEFHADSPADVELAANALLSELGLTVESRQGPTILSDDIIHNVDAYHAQLINTVRHGALLLPRDSLFILEVEPAGYIALAVNEAEKAADVSVVEFRVFGRTGTLYISGKGSEIEAARRAAIAALKQLSPVRKGGK